MDKFLKNSPFLPEIFETSRDCLMVVDNQGNIHLFNRAAEELTGYKKRDVIGKPCSIFDCQPCTAFDGNRDQRHPQLTELGARFNRPCTIRTCDGRLVRLLKSAVVLRDPNSGEIIGTIEAMREIGSLDRTQIARQKMGQVSSGEHGFMGMLGKSPTMCRLYEHMRNASQSEAPILILGESGSGKNLVARALHKLSRRKKGPFLQMNCGALNEQLLESELFGHKKGAFTGAVSDRIGRFEASDDGTIFLDEIGDMPLTMQVKLLRVLEEKVVERVGDHQPIPVNVRLLSATNKDPSTLVSEGKFREDLLYRVNSVVIKVPPLRERREDIPLIASHYLMRISAANRKEIGAISPSAMEILVNFPWPGNVRRLINALEHSAVACASDTIDVEDLPDYVVGGEKPVSSKGPSEKMRIMSVLAQCNGNKTHAARQLGISRVTLWKRIKAMGIE